MIVDMDLELQPGWGTHTDDDGSNIGGKRPTDFGFQPNGPNDVLFHTQGGAYADWEAYIERPVLPNSGHLGLQYNLTADENTAAAAQAIETDTILCIGGWNYNLSAQLNYAEGGKYQIAKENGGWVDTGFVVGRLAPLARHTVAFEYAFDIVAHKSSVVAITLDGMRYTIPENLQNVPATQKGWRDGAIFQVQMDLGSKGGAYDIDLARAQFAWW